MEKGGRGGQRVACVSERFSKPESVWKRKEKRDDCTHSNPILFPTSRHAGRHWTFLTDPVGFPHTCPHGSLFFWPIRSRPDPNLRARASRFLQMFPTETESSAGRVPCFANANACLFWGADVLVFACWFACMYQIVHLESDCWSVRSFSCLEFHRRTSRVSRSPYCPPGLLIKQVTHKGRLFGPETDPVGGAGLTIPTQDDGASRPFPLVLLCIISRQIFECWEFCLIGHIYVYSVLQREATFT